MYRALPVLVLAFALVFFFVSERTNIFSETHSSQSVVTLWAFSMQAKTMLQLRDDFQTLHPDIRVEVQTVAWDSLQSKTLWAIAANSNVPDVIVASSEWMGGLADNGALDPLEDMLGSDFFKRYFPGTLGIYQYPEIHRDRPQFRGKMRQYGVPLDLDLMLIFYRHDVLAPLMQKLGMSEFPQSWADFEKLGEAVKQHAAETNQPVHLLYLDPDDIVPLSMAFLPASGGSFLDSTLQHAMIDKPNAVAAFDFFHRLLKTGIALSWERNTQEDPIFLYKKNRALSNIAGPWYTKYLESKAPEQAGKWRVALFPRRQPQLPTCGLGGACLAVPYNAKNKAGALQLIQYMATERFAMAYFQRVGSPPPQRTAWNNPALERPLPYFGGQNVYGVVRQAIESARPLQLLPKSEITKGPVLWALRQIVVHDKPNDPTLQRAAAETNRLLRQ